MQSSAAALTDDTRLAPNEAEVAAKAYDDEVVFMHLGSGVYGSIERLGAIIWEAIQKHHSVREIAEVLAAHYEVSLDEALRDVRALAAQLLEEGMARQVADAGPTARIAADAARRPYKTPRLVIYRDMEDLLALDPPLPQYAEAPWKKS